MNSEIKNQLHKLALKRSIPFCMGCYENAPSGICSKCGSDDLARLVPSVGLDWGTDWIVEHILETELSPVNQEDAFEESIRQCYPETTQVGWMTFDTVELMKTQDPISWQMAVSEFESERESEETIYSPNSGGHFYWIHEVTNLIEKELS